MVVLGGYNSSNTFNLARICAARVPTFHIADPGGLLSAGRDPAQAARREGRDGDVRLAAGWPGEDRADVWRVHAR